MAMPPRPPPNFHRNSRRVTERDVDEFRYMACSIDENKLVAVQDDTAGAGEAFFVGERGEVV